jgi:hypothetical protein
VLLLLAGRACNGAGFGFAGGVACGAAAGAAISVTVPVGTAGGAGAGLGCAPPTFDKGCRGCFGRVVLRGMACGAWCWGRVGRYRTSDEGWGRLRRFVTSAEGSGRFVATGGLWTNAGAAGHAARAGRFAELPRGCGGGVPAM